MEPSSSEGVDRGKNDDASSGREEDTDSSTGTKMFVLKGQGRRKLAKKRMLLVLL